MELKCPFCDKKTILSNVSAYSGKTVRISCTNTACNQLFEVKIPPAEEKTTLFRKNENSLFAELSVIRGHLSESQKFEIGSGVHIIGRYSQPAQATVQIRSKDMLISRRHCEIKGVLDLEGKSMNFIIRDLESKNKVYVNGNLLENKEAIYLSDKDIIKLGMTEIRFERINSIY
jgi:pSer/pThr/pTyr-binding forkhead associated (FHA) protein